MIVAGLGARAAATAAEMVAAVEDACGRAGFEIADVGIVAGRMHPATDDALREAAVALNSQCMLIDAVALQAQSARCVTHSERALAAAGVPSVAEAAAMAAAGPEGMLFLPRIAFANVTVALAVGPGEAGQ